MSLMIPDRKKMATMIVSRMGKGGKTDDVEMKPEGGKAGEVGDPAVELAQDLLHAVETKSPQGVADAIKAMVLHCQGGDDEPEASEGSDYED